jgi:immunoglobulin I-set domain protein
LGVYSAQIVISNLNNSLIQLRNFTLLVGQSNRFTELFDAGDNDLAFSTLTFTPDGSSNFYSLCVEPAVAFPVDPTDGTTLTNITGTSIKVTLPGTNTVSFYGVTRSNFWVGAFGYITFNGPDTTYVESLSAHFNQPRISALFHKLLIKPYPFYADRVSWKQLWNRVAVTYENIQATTALPLSSFQIEMFTDGRIRLTYLNLYCPDALVGLSKGQGVPPYFLDIDLSSQHACQLAPLIWSHPAPFQTQPGKAIRLNVSASGLQPLQYHWYKDGIHLINGGRFSGVGSETLVISNAVDSDAGLYSVRITNDFGFAISSNAEVQVSGLDHFAWGHIPSPQSAGVPFVVTIQARNPADGPVTNFTGTVSLTGWVWDGLQTNTILPSPTSGSYAGLDPISGTTVGYAFTPNTNITVTHFRHFLGDKVSIWTDTGTLLSSRNVVSVGTWTETPLLYPIQLNSGTTYRLGVWCKSSYYRFDMGSTFPNGTINQSYYDAGDAFPIYTANSVHWYFVDLRYIVGPLPIVPVSPVLSGSFTQGIWTGSVTVPLSAVNFVLRADDTSQHSGQSEVFSIGNAPRLFTGSSSNGPIVSWTAGAPALMLETSTNLASGAWVPVSGAPIQVGDEYQFPVDTSGPSRFFRLRYSPGP